MSGRVSVPCWHATPVANAPWKPLIIGEGQARYQGHGIGGKYSAAVALMYKDIGYKTTFFRIFL